MTDLNVRLIIKAIDQASRPLRGISKSLDSLSGPIVKARGAVDALVRRSGIPVIAAAVGRVGRATAGVGRQVVALTRRFALLATAAGVGLTLALGRVASAGDQIAKTAGKLGVGVEPLQELQFAAGRAGISQETFNMALQRFTRRAAEAAAGTGEAVGALKFLGVQLKDNEGRMRPAEALLGDVADAIAKIEDPALRVRVAFKLFDSEGVSMVNMLKDGRAEMDAMRQRARDLGFVMSKDTADASVRYTDAMFDLRGALGGLANVIGGEVMPVLIPLIGQLTAFVAANRDLVRVETVEFLAALPGHVESVVEAFGEAVATMRPVLDILAAVAEAVGPLNLVLGALGVLIGGKLIVALGSLVAALGPLAVALLTTPFGQFLIAIAAIAAGAALIVENWDGIAAFFENLWGRALAAFDDATGWVGDQVSALAGLADTLEAAWSGVGAFFEGVWERLKATFAEGALFVLEKVKAVIDALPAFARQGLGLDGLDGIVADLRQAAKVSAGAAGAPAQSGIEAAGPGRSETRLIVELNNAPPGTRVTAVESTDRGLDYEVDVGMAMAGP